MKSASSEGGAGPTDKESIVVERVRVGVGALGMGEGTGVGMDFGDDSGESFGLVSVLRLRPPLGLGLDRGSIET